MTACDLEHFPIRWNHLIEKELLQNQTLQRVFVAKLEPTSTKHALERRSRFHCRGQCAFIEIIKLAADRHAMRQA